MYVDAYMNTYIDTYNYLAHFRDFDDRYFHSRVNRQQ